MKFEWKGVMPALTTKFNAIDQVDLDMHAINLQAQVQAGVHGLILGGSLGEASTLEMHEKRELTQFTLEKVGHKIPVVVNISEQSTKKAVEAANLAQSWGAHGLMVLPPLKYKATDGETVDYFKAIASETDLPIMLYNNPVDYKIEITLQMMEELLKMGNICAIKESTRDVSNVTRLKNQFGDDLKILCGVDTLALESFALGADGWVAGLVCAFPNETVAIYQLMKQGKLEEAVKIYRWFLPLLELDIDPQLVQNIKLAEVATGIGTEYVRLPRKPLAGKRREEVLQIIETGLKNRPQLPNF